MEAATGESAQRLWFSTKSKTLIHRVRCIVFCLKTTQCTGRAAPTDVLCYGNTPSDHRRTLTRLIRMLSQGLRQIVEPDPQFANVFPPGNSRQQEFNDRDKLSRALYRKANGTDGRLLAVDDLPSEIEQESLCETAEIRCTRDVGRKGHQAWSHSP